MWRSTTATLSSSPWASEAKVPVWPCSWTTCRVGAETPESQTATLAQLMQAPESPQHTMLWPDRVFGPPNWSTGRPCRTLLWPKRVLAHLKRSFARDRTSLPHKYSTTVWPKWSFGHSALQSRRFCRQQHVPLLWPSCRGRCQRRKKWYRFFEGLTIFHLPSTSRLASNLVRAHAVRQKSTLQD
jgi:hypothetical protein